MSHSKTNSNSCSCFSLFKSLEFLTRTFGNLRIFNNFLSSQFSSFMQILVNSSIDKFELSISISMKSVSNSGLSRTVIKLVDKLTGAFGCWVPLTKKNFKIFNLVNRNHQKSFMMI